MNRDPCIVDPYLAGAFIRWLAQKCQYALSSVEKVIGPSLNRISGKNQFVCEKIQQGYRDNKKAKSTVKK